MSIEIMELTPADEADWNAYVDATPCATFFHRVEWKRVIEESYGFAGRHLIARRAGAICGILPLAYVRRFPFPPALISSPLCTHGGAVADSDDIVQELEDAAAALARSLNVAYLEIRNLGRRREGWPVNSRMVTFRKRIYPSDDDNMRAIPPKVRARVRKAVGRGFTVETNQDLSRFFPVYARSVRNLGTPVFAKGYFQALIDAFGDDCRIKTLLLDGEVQVSSMYFYFKDDVLAYYIGSVPEARRESAHSLLCWETMSEAAERGCRVFDIGRSTVGTGAYDFKKFWGFKPIPLNYQYMLVSASAVPNITPTNPKYRTARRIWRSLPLPIASAMGPMMSKALV